MFPTEAHYHTTDSACLERIDAIRTGRHIEGRPEVIPAEHWWRCTYLVVPLRPPQCGEPYIAHEHDGRFIAHETRDHCGFPA